MLAPPPSPREAQLAPLDDKPFTSHYVYTQHKWNHDGVCVACGRASSGLKHCAGEHSYVLKPGRIAPKPGEQWTHWIDTQHGFLKQRRNGKSERCGFACVHPGCTVELKQLTESTCEPQEAVTRDASPSREAVTARDARIAELNAQVESMRNRTHPEYQLHHDANGVASLQRLPPSQVSPNSMRNPRINRHSCGMTEDEPGAGTMRAPLDPRVEVLPAREKFLYTTLYGTDMRPMTAPFPDPMAPVPSGWKLHFDCRGTPYIRRQDIGEL